jgi:hypothetical protein
MGSAPKPPPPSAEEKAMTRRQRMRLDAEIAENEKRLKAMAQKKFGKQSLLAKAVMPSDRPQGPQITPGFIKTPSGAIKKDIARRMFRAVQRKQRGG